MKLLSLSMCNFRQFRGEQQIRFAHDEPKKVTLYFGANGSGKTTLLNAFTWCLYGNLSDDLEAQQRLVTDAVWHDAQFGSIVETWVEVRFEHNEVEYRCRRATSGTKGTDEQNLDPARLEVWETLPTGATRPVTAAQPKIDSILPKRLSQFFFFNGERIEKLVKENAYSEVKEAIKSVLGLQEIEMAIEHLPRVATRLQTDLRKHGGDEVASITNDLEKVQGQREDALHRLSELSHNLTSVRAEKAHVQSLLQQHAATASLQKQRDELDRSIQMTRNDIEQSDAVKAKLVSERGFLAFTNELTALTFDISNDLSQKGQLPAPLKRDFVESLLERGSCLCGTPLLAGTSERATVEDWRSKVGLAEVEGKWMELRGGLALMGDARKQLESDLQQYRSRSSNLRANLVELQHKKSVVDSELAEVPREDMQRLSEKQISLERNQSHLENEVGALKLQIDTYVSKEQSLNVSLQNATVKNALAERIRARLTLVREVNQALEKILKIRTDSVRFELDQRVKSIYRRVSVKSSVPVLTEDFELRLVRENDSDQRSVAKSTGENQILSLSFVAAVSELAADYQNRKGRANGLFDEGGYFPIVMDAAFGSLDNNYQKDISRALAQLSPQMVVLVSKSQGLGTVMNELEPHLGHLGVIVTNSSKSTNADEFIDLGGAARPYILTQQESDFAELLEVH